MYACIRRLLTTYMTLWVVMVKLLTLKLMIWCFKIWTTLPVALWRYNATVYSSVFADSATVRTLSQLPGLLCIDQFVIILFMVCDMEGYMQLNNIVLYVRETVVYYIKQVILQHTVILLGIKMGALKNLLTRSCSSLLRLQGNGCTYKYWFFIVPQKTVIIYCKLLCAFWK